MRQHREVTTRRAEGGWLRPNRALSVQACLSQGAQLLPTPHAHFTQRPDTCTPAAARRTPTARMDEFPACT
jgi:hypothetical protein